MRSKSWLLWGALAMVGCDPRDFDSVLDRAPVLSLTPPDGYKAGDFGKVVLPLSTPNKPGVTARFLVAGSDAVSLAVVELNAAGQATVHVATKAEVMPLELETNAPVKSAVELADKRILLGTPNFGADPQTMSQPIGRHFFLELKDVGARVAFDIRRADPPGAHRRFGLAVGNGNVSGGAEEDYVVLSDEGATLLEDGQLTKQFRNTGADCDASIESSLFEKYRYRAVGVGDVIPGESDEIVVGVPHPSAPGKVLVMRKEMTGLTCVARLEAPGRQQRFGTHVSVVDFNGDGQKDVLVGSPPDRAYVYLGPLAMGAATMPSRELKHPDVADSAQAGDFGFRVLAMEADGNPGLELVVSAPEAAVGGKASAGQVIIFKADGSKLATISANDPDEQGSFGFTLSALRFTPSGCGAERPLLAVGAASEVFTFYRLPQGPADPRCLK